ncbi:hypothetical protein ACIBCT_21225 [Streptosporangium sp. NPDC050855]|uniref:hypothetical protein n=1 Tax=Streptosporangium sp. NPDC050855 TaxID=3366194 RepID=UPI0037A4E1DA
MIDIEAVLIAWLEASVDVSASTETPSDLDSQLPWVQVVRTGGGYDGFRRDQPTVDVAVFAASGPAAFALASQIQYRLHEEFASHAPVGAVISRVETSTGPHRVPYDNPGMRRYEASYRFVVHPA